MLNSSAIRAPPVGRRSCCTTPLSIVDTAESKPEFWSIIPLHWGVNDTAIGD
jgi:hypothetical protein